MKTRLFLAALGCLLLLSASRAQIPPHLNYQGRVAVGGTNFHGTGQFKFALVVPNNLNQTATASAVATVSVTSLIITSGGSGYSEPPVVTIAPPDDPEGVQAIAVANIDGGVVTDITLTEPGSGYFNNPVQITIAPPPPNLQYFTSWSNDGTSMSGSEPTAAISLPVANGLYSVQLGDPAAGMATLNPGVFSTGVQLRVWFDDGVHGFQQLAPDQPLGTAPYAFRAALAETVPLNSLTSEHIAEGGITSASLAPGAVTSSSLAPGAVAAASFDTGITPPAAGQVLSYTTNGLRWVAGGGLTLPFNGTGTNPGNPLFQINAMQGGPAIWAESSGLAVVGKTTGGTGVSGQATAAEGLGVRGTATGTNGHGVVGVSAQGHGVQATSDGAGKSGVFATSTAGNGVSGSTTAAGYSGVYGSAEDPTGVGGYFYNAAGDALRSVGRTSLYGWLYVRDSDIWLGSTSRRGSPAPAVVDWRDPGNNTSQLYLNFGDAWQETKIGGAVTEVKTLRITGGADLAEPFPMSHDNVEPGAVVVIDEENPGKLRVSGVAYDKKVAGIVSGADGIQPGISMIQEDMLEAGKNVALSGRVYVKANNSAGDIEPGDLLTTSPVPGEAMKASDHDRAQGAILGKAMTPLSGPSGKVLVLVTLQ